MKETACKTKWGFTEYRKKKIIFPVCFHGIFYSACVMQEFGFFLQVCNCVHVCIWEYMHARVSLPPRSIFACENRCFVTLPCRKGQAPPSFSHLLPLFSSFASICSSGPCGWHLRPSGGWEESGHLTNWLPLQLKLRRSSLSPIRTRHAVREERN